MTNTLIGLIQSLLLAVFGVLQVFGVLVLTDDQRGAVLALYGALVAVVLALNNAYGKTHAIKKAARESGESVPKV